MKRYLSQREAERCEKAKEPVCKCRCGGAKHGANRSVVSGGDFSELPMDDPHYRPSMNTAQTIRFLKDAAVRFAYPRIANRDSYVKEFGWDAWLAQDRLEQQSYHDALQILADALRDVKNL